MNTTSTTHMHDVRRRYFENLKTGHIYWYLGEVINATNDNDGQKMILYNDREGNYYVRDIEEFNKKFVEVT